MRRAQNDACYYCGTSIHANAQVDYLKPLAQGGSDGYVNIMLVCASCNTAKGTLNERQFWTSLQKQLPPAQFGFLRKAAKDMKKKRGRRPSGIFWGEEYWREKTTLLFVENEAWWEVFEPLWKKQRRSTANRRKYERRAEAIKESELTEPSYTSNDTALLRRAQNDACYYCGTSIHANAHVEHLSPLSCGGSNGFSNIILACADCNMKKHTLDEQSYWKKLEKQLSPTQFSQRRKAANDMKKEKGRLYRDAERDSMAQAQQRLDERGLKLRVLRVVCDPARDSIL